MIHVIFTDFALGLQCNVLNLKAKTESHASYA